VAWFLYFRSGFLLNTGQNNFIPSDWARSLLNEITDAFLSDSFNLVEVDKKRFNFYREIKNHIESQDYLSIEEKFAAYVTSDSLVFKDIPIELDIAKNIYLNSGLYYANKEYELDSLVKCGESELLLSGVSKTVVDELMREYIFLDNSIYATISGDGSAEIMERVSSVLGGFAEIVCERSVNVTEAGKRQWVRLQYAHESHWDEDRMSTYMNHPANGVRISGDSVGIIFFKKKNKFHNIRDLKEEVRDLLNLNSSQKKIQTFPHVHFPDTHKEVEWIANAAFNRNSQDWMNRACDVYPKNFSFLINEYKQEMLLRTDQCNFCLDTGAVLALNGIRDTSDIDYISISDSEKPIVNSRMESHNSQYEGHNLSVREIIENPTCHFIYKNIKISTLKEVLAFKEYRAKTYEQSPSSKKDKKDALMIKKFIAKPSQLENNYKAEPKEVANSDKNLVNIRLMIFKLIVKILKLILPLSVVKILRGAYVKIIIKSNTKLKKRVPNSLG